MTANDPVRHRSTLWLVIVVAFAVGAIGGYVAGRMVPGTVPRTDNYSLLPAGPGAGAYRINNHTGEVWWLIGSRRPEKVGGLPTIPPPR